MKIELGTIINHLKIEIDINKNVKIKKDKYCVIGINDNYCVIDNHLFDTIQLKKDQYIGLYTLNTPHSGDMNFDIASINDYITTSIYTTSSFKIAFDKCKRDLEIFIKHEKNGIYSKYTNVVSAMTIEGGK